MASEKAPVKIAKKDAVFMGIILVLAVVLAFTLFQNTITASSQQKVVDSVVATYRTLTESDVEALTVKDEGNLYKILLRLKLADGDVLRETYVTKDGRFFSEAGSVIEISSFMETLDKEKNFADCLKEKKFVLFGQKSEANTYQQLLVIGNFANKVYFDCTGTNLQACQQIGISTIPVIFYNGQNYTGVQTRASIESLTGCKY
ncbi:MAG: hypothetical protein NTU57_04940 [Candidatus Aenigmarchaeota archaeon]|nr:hypothetical protein [Candidatus Aenigmarchaeota archaeon]